MVEALLRELEARRVAVSVRRGRLVLEGDVPPDLLEKVRDHKAEILLHLAGGNSGDTGNIGKTEKTGNVAKTGKTGNVVNLALIRRYRVTLTDGKSFTALATAEQDEEADRIEFALHWGARLLLLERIS